MSPDGPLRILIEGQHTLWFKGVDDALDAVSRMREPHTATLVALDPTDAPAQEGLEVIGGLKPDEMREQYARHDVLLKLSRVEGLPLPLVEACHVGVPCVVTPFTGHDEVIRHGENGLVVGFDDVDGAAAALDLLARDRSLLRRLSAGAIESMSGWPSADEAAAAFATALTEVAEAPEPRRGAGRGRGLEALAGGGGGRPNRARRGRAPIPGAGGVDPSTLEESVQLVRRGRARGAHELAYVQARPADAASEPPPPVDEHPRYDDRRAACARAGRTRRRRGRAGRPPRRGRRGTRMSSGARGPRTAATGRG